MIVTLSISTDFSDGQLHGWTDQGASPVASVVSVTGQSFTRVIRFGTRDCLSPQIAVPAGLQVQVSGWLNSIGLASHTSNGDPWTVSIGLQCINAAGTTSWVTSAALTIPPGTGWTFVSDTITVPADSISAQGWLQIASTSTAVATSGLFAEAAVLAFQPLPSGLAVIALPSDTVPYCAAPSSIEWERQEVVAASTNPFTGQQVVFDWQASWWEGNVSFAGMHRYDWDMWDAFASQLRGQLNAFQMGDPLAVLPKGTALGTPVVNGASQTGYALLTRGWPANAPGLLLTGDYIQIGYRMYKVMNTVNADNNGNATLAIWPNLRESPADGASIQTKNCKGLFRLKQNNGNKSSVNASHVYGFGPLAIREAI